MTKDEAERSRWTFYEAVNVGLCIPIILLNHRALYLWGHTSYFDIFFFRGRPTGRRPHCLSVSLSVYPTNSSSPQGRPVRSVPVTLP